MERDWNERHSYSSLERREEGPSTSCSFLIFLFSLPLTVILLIRSKSCKNEGVSHSVISQGSRKLGEECPLAFFCLVSHMSCFLWLQKQKDIRHDSSAESAKCH